MSNKSKKYSKSKKRSISQKKTSLTKKTNKKTNKKKLTRNIKLYKSKLNNKSSSNINDTDFKDSFNDTCKTYVLNLIKNKNILLNRQELELFCSCIKKKITLKNINKINNKFFSKCINKIKKKNNKRLTKFYTRKLNSKK